MSLCSEPRVSVTVGWGVDGEKEALPVQGQVHLLAQRLCTIVTSVVWFSWIHIQLPRVTCAVLIRELVLCFCSCELGLGFIVVRAA